MFYLQQNVSSCDLDIAIGHIEIMIIFKSSSLFLPHVFDLTHLFIRLLVWMNFTVIDSWKTRTVCKW